MLLFGTGHPAATLTKTVAAEPRHVFRVSRNAASTCGTSCAAIPARSNVHAVRNRASCRDPHENGRGRAAPRFPRQPQRGFRVRQIHVPPVSQVGLTTASSREAQRAFVLLGFFRAKPGISLTYLVLEGRGTTLSLRTKIAFPETQRPTQIASAAEVST